MARARSLSLFTVLAVASACSNGGAASERDTARQTAPQTAPPAAPDSAQAREAVLRLEQEFFQSLMRGDTTTAARTLAEDYIGFTGDGNRETKAQALANIHRDSTTAAAVTIDSILIDSTIVRVHGDAVVAQLSGTFRAHDARQTATVGFRNTDVFVWRDGRWQIVATHLSKVGAPQTR